MTPEEYQYNKKIPGWFNPGDIDALYSLASKIKNGTIIELGSMHGKSSYCLSKSSPTSKIFCFDYWKDDPTITADGNSRPNNLELFSLHTIDCPNITPIQLDPSIKTIPIWEEPVDMVFIDTLHKNPDDWGVIKFWLPKVKAGGIICGHDYYHPGNSPIIHYPDVVKNIKKLEKILNQPVVAHNASCMWSFTVDFVVDPQIFQAYED